MTVRTRLLIADPDPRGRLALLAALRGGFEVQVVEPDEDPVRAVRRYRPDLVLLAIARRRPAEALQLCRAIKTDGPNPPRVAIIDRRRRLHDPAAALPNCLGDGYLGGAFEAQALVPFVRDVGNGAHPVVLGHRAAGLLDRLLRRL